MNSSLHEIGFYLFFFTYMYKVYFFMNKPSDYATYYFRVRMGLLVNQNVDDIRTDERYKRTSPIHKHIHVLFTIQCKIK